jgi:hypothetical protein
MLATMAANGSLHARRCRIAMVVPVNGTLCGTSVAELKSRRDPCVEQ